MSKQAILTKIEEKAHETAEAIVINAEADATAVRQEASEKFEADYKKGIAKAQAEADALVARQKTLSSLEARKIELKARQDAINAVYERAFETMTKLSDKEYCEFYTALAIKNIEDGDTVISEDRRLDEKWFASLKSATGKNITFEQFSNNGFGVILRSDKYDKNLTLRSVMADVRAQTESEVEAELFG